MVTGCWFKPNGPVVLWVFLWSTAQAERWKRKCLQVSYSCTQFPVALKQFFSHLELALWQISGIKMSNVRSLTVAQSLWLYIWCSLLSRHVICSWIRFTPWCEVCHLPAAFGSCCICVGTLIISISSQRELRRFMASHMRFQDKSVSTWIKKKKLCLT